MRTKLWDKLFGNSHPTEERSYFVEGEIRFKVLNHTETVNPTELRFLILMADDNFPWYDVQPIGEAYYMDGSMHHLFDGVEEHDEIISLQSGKPEIEWCFKILPRRCDMAKSQLYAYEKYLAKLAEEISHKYLVNIKEVKSRIYIQSEKTFACSE